MPAPPNRLFLGVMGIGAECEVGERKEEKSLGTRQMLCGCTDIFEFPAEEVSPSQALLSLPHNAPPQDTWGKCW